MKKALSPAAVGIAVALFVVALVFFGYRSLNASNVHSYDEGTPEQRAALAHSFSPHPTPSPTAPSH